MLLLQQQRSVVVAVTQKTEPLAVQKNTMLSAALWCRAQCIMGAAQQRVEEADMQPPATPLRSANKQNKSLLAAGHESYHTQSVTPTLVCVQD